MITIIGLAFLVIDFGFIDVPATVCIGKVRKEGIHERAAASVRFLRILTLAQRAEPKWLSVIVVSPSLVYTTTTHPVRNLSLSTPLIRFELQAPCSAGAAWQGNDLGGGRLGLVLLKIEP